MSTIHATNTPVKQSYPLPFPGQSRTENKSLARANGLIQVIGKAVKQVRDRSNCSDSELSFIIFLAVFTKKFFNIRFKDMQISEFKPAGERSTRHCIVLLISLLILPQSSKCKIIKEFGLHYKSACIMLDDLINSGYVRKYAGKFRFHNAAGYSSKDMDLHELTAKGYDKIQFIFSLLIDKRLL